MSSVVMAIVIAKGRRGVAPGARGRGREFPCVRLQDARYVIHTITFHAVSCPENSAFFRKNQREHSEKNVENFCKLFLKN